MMASNQARVDGEIELVGIGEVKVIPDQVTIEYSIVVNHEDAKVAKQKVERAVSDFFEALKPLELDKDAVAQNISTQPIFSDRDIFGRRHLVEYEVSRQVNVLIRDFSLICKVNDLAMDCGLDRIVSCDYSLSDRKKYEDEAAHKAIEEIKHQAELLAHEFGLALGKPSHIEYESSHRRYQPGVLYAARYRGDVGAGDDSDNSEPVYKPDPVTVSVTVNVTYVYQH